MRYPLQIVLTGGPGGGKTALVKELMRDPVYSEQFAALPEAIFSMSYLGIPLTEKLFQRVMVYLQVGLEDGLSRALGTKHQRCILCHRGSLDPLAYWLARGWPEEEFYEYTETTRDEHYGRYATVIHLVSAADGAERAYKRWPDAHRSETVVQAIQIDRFLGEVWGRHAHYYRIDNMGKDWETKSKEARRIIAGLLSR